MFWTWCGREKKEKISKRFQFTRFFLLCTVRPGAYWPPQPQSRLVEPRARLEVPHGAWFGGRYKAKLVGWVVLISGDEGPFQPLNADWLTFFLCTCCVVLCGVALAEGTNCSSHMPVPRLSRDPLSGTWPISA